MIAFINTHDDCFERTLEIGHMTASAFLLNKDATKTLLMHHKKLDLWVQLGCHCDGDSDMLQVAIKEAEEESGILGIASVTDEIFDIDVHLIPENPKEKAHYHYDVRFLLHVTSDEDFVKNHESYDLQWFGKYDELPTDKTSVTRMFDKWRKK